MTLMKFEEAALEEAAELLKVEGNTVSINKRLLGLILEIAKANKTVYLPSPIPASPGYPQPMEVPTWRGPYIVPQTSPLNPIPIDPLKTKDIYKDFDYRGKTLD